MTAACYKIDKKTPTSLFVKKSILNMRNKYVHFEQLYILHLCVDRYGLCFNTIQHTSNICWLLIEKKTPF